jgi:hypothetical protein
VLNRLVSYASEEAVLGQPETSAVPFSLMLVEEVEEEAMLFLQQNYCIDRNRTLSHQQISSFALIEFVHPLLVASKV